jgi:hypothetical protein
MADDEYSVAELLQGLSGDSTFLGVRTKVVDEDTDSTTFTGLKRRQLLDKMINTVEHLNDHTLDPKIVSPHFLDEFGIVLSLDPNSRCSGNARRRIGDRDRTGCGSLLGGRAATRFRRPNECDDLAVNQECGGTGGEQSRLVVPIFETDGPSLDGFLPSGDRTAPA